MYQKGFEMEFAGLNVEYKREYVESIKKTVIAFANSDGGKIYIGFNDDGSVFGVSNVDSIILQVTSAVRDAIKPDVTIFTNCETKIMEGKSVVVLTVQKGTARPYYLAKKGIRPEGVFIRQGPSTAPATDTSILKMIRETSGEHYEDIRSLQQKLTFDALENEFELAEIKLQTSQMRTLHIVGEDELFTNLGLLLSDQCVHTIKLAVFEGITKEVFKDRYEFTGCLFEQLRECYSFIDKYNKRHARFDQLMRIDTRDYPITAIREALLNAIIHRDYSFSGSTLISMYDDRIEMVTIGGLVKGISQEDMLLGVSILRHTNLANICYRLNLVEAYGTGIPKIIESYQKFNLEPIIETTNNAFKITLPNTEFLRVVKEEKGEVFFNEGEQLVLDMFISSEIINRSKIEEELVISQPMAVKHLKNLLDKSAIVKIGNGKNVRYRLK